MATELIGYISVIERSNELGLQVPSGMTILPRNFDTANSRADLYHESSTLDIRRLWAQAGVIESRIEPQGEKIATISEHFYDWIGPLIFLGASWYIENEHLVNVSLNVISNYVTEWFKGVSGEKRVSFGFVLEKTKTKKCVRLNYDGPPEKIAELTSLIKDIMNES
jgi:hypothetical protein